VGRGTISCTEPVKPRHGSCLPGRYKSNKLFSTSSRITTYIELGHFFALGMYNYIAGMLRREGNNLMSKTGKI
jgi:hypothetical protein